MADLKTISLPHGSIPTQMFGNVNLQNAMMYVNENFAAVKSGVNDAISATNTAIDAKADADHDHDDAYAALEHTHGQSEITGLSSALDGKADLNHEHQQYLTSLPAHYHTLAEVQGLNERIQGKAEKTHAHTMAQVEGLATELGVKASTAYVDQQTSRVSQSISTICKQEIKDAGLAKAAENEYGGGHTYPDASSLIAAMKPKDVEAAPDNETEAQKIARIGTSPYAARADHKHVFSAEDTSPDAISGANVSQDASDSATNYLNPSGAQAAIEGLQSQWTRGDIDTQTGERKGVKITVCTSIKRYSSTSGFYAAVFSDLYFDENGMLCKVETARNSHKVI